MFRELTRNCPETRARRKREKAAARLRNDQNWGALWGASAAPPEAVAAAAAHAPADAAAVPLALPSRDDAEPAPPPPSHSQAAAAAATAPSPPPPRANSAAAAQSPHAQDDAAAPSQSPHSPDAAAQPHARDAAATAPSPPPPPPTRPDSDDESAPIHLPATGQTGTQQWSQLSALGPASQRAASQWAPSPPPTWDDALRRRLRAAAPAEPGHAACAAYAADERARAALPNMNVSRGDVDVLFAPEEDTSWGD